MEKLRESVDQLKQGKELAEKQIRTMSGQMMASLENYQKGFDDILERNKAEYEADKAKLKDSVEQLRKQVASLQLINPLTPTADIWVVQLGVIHEGRPHRVGRGRGVKPNADRSGQGRREGFSESGRPQHRQLTAPASVTGQVRQT